MLSSAAQWQVSGTATQSGNNTRQALLAISDSNSGKPIRSLKGNSFAVYGFTCAGHQCGFLIPASVEVQEDFAGLYILTVKGNQNGSGLGALAIRVATPLTPADIAAAQAAGGKAPLVEDREVAFVVLQ